jgi:hypothetical protein
MLSRILLASSAVLLFSAAHLKTQSPVAMLGAAKAFLASLTPEQTAKAKMDLTTEARLQWHFVPDNNYQEFYKTTRKGLTLREMTPAQRHLAQAMLASSLSQRGFMKASTIMSLEDVLRILESDSGERRNPEKYYFSIYGEPSETATWGMRIEGHHISLTFVIAGGKVLAAPTFFGSNPAEVRQGPRTGLRVLAREEDLGRDLLMALTPEQKKVAIVDTKAYPDILTTVKRSAALDGQPSGLSAAKMTPKQRELLAAVLDEYCQNVPEDVAEGRTALVKAAGTNLNFAWAGVEEKKGPHYYRVQGPGFLVEYDNTQNGANHVHSVWRDLKADFGGDVLKAHYQEAHPSKPAKARGE